MLFDLHIKVSEDYVYVCETSDSFRYIDRESPLQLRVGETVDEYGYSIKAGYWYDITEGKIDSTRLNASYWPARRIAEATKYKFSDDGSCLIKGQVVDYDTSYCLVEFCKDIPSIISPGFLIDASFGGISRIENTNCKYQLVSYEPSGEVLDYSKYFREEKEPLAQDGN